jgi:hypothetical protein
MSIMRIFKRRRCADCGLTIKCFVVERRYGVNVPVCIDRPACAKRVESNRVRTFVRLGLMEFSKRVMNAQGRRK